MAEINKRKRVSDSGVAAALVLSPVLKPGEMNAQSTARRIIRNRESVQRYQQRKQQYVEELQRTVNTLEADESVLMSKLSSYKQQCEQLQVDNNNLKQNVSTLKGEKLLKDAHLEMLKEETERMRELYMQQQQQLQEQQQQQQQQQQQLLEQQHQQQQQQLLEKQQQLEQQQRQQMVGFEFDEDELLNINLMNPDLFNGLM